MTTNTPIQNDNANQSFVLFTGPSASVADDTVKAEPVEQIAVDLANASISFALLPDNKAQAITDARQHSLDQHPFAPLAEGMGAPLKVPQAIKSEQHPGQSYVTYPAPSVPEEPSPIVTSAVALMQDVGQWISQGPIGGAFRRLDALLSKFEDKDTVELRKIHPLLGSGLGLAMTDADIPGYNRKE